MTQIQTRVLISFDVFKVRTQLDVNVPMTLSITHLGTGSSGNSTLIATEKVKLLIDQGFSGRKLSQRLDRIGLKPEDIDAILVTHHHADHGGGARICQKKWGMTVYANEYTAQELDLLPEYTIFFENLEMLEFNGGVSILPVPVPHDGADNVAFIVSYGGERAAIITDLGSWTDELVQHVQGCQHIAVESNYDEKRLMFGPYPRTLKDRIVGRGGHLSNKQTGAFLAEVCTEQTRSITLLHLSVENNRPHLAESTVLYYIDDIFTGDIRLSLQDGPEFSTFLGRRETADFDAEIHVFKVNA